MSQIACSPLGLSIEWPSGVTMPMQGWPIRVRPAAMLDRPWLVPIGVSVLGRLAGVVSERRWSVFTSVRDEMTRITHMLQGYTLSPQAGFFLVARLIEAYAWSSTNRAGQRKALTFIKMGSSDRSFNCLSLSYLHIYNTSGRLTCYGIHTSPRLILGSFFLTSVM